MKKLAVWGVVGGLMIGSALVAPAHAQLKTLKDAAGKLADKVMGTEAQAADVSGTAVVPNAPSDKSARVTLLDKQTNRRQTLVLVAGEVQTVGTIQVKLTKCLSDYSATLGQDVAWLDVTEGAEGNGRSTPWFSGWMFNTYPEVSTLDHARYDMQLQGCGVRARQIVKSSGSAPIVDSAPVVDTESGGAGPDSDPYFVPGVGKQPEAPAAPVETPAAEPAAPAVDAEAPAVDAEAPAAPVEAPAAEQPAPAAGDQQDLHRMMDSGTY